MRKYKFPKKLYGGSSESFEQSQFNIFTPIMASDAIYVYGRWRTLFIWSIRMCHGEKLIMI